MLTLLGKLAALLAAATSTLALPAVPNAVAPASAPASYRLSGSAAGADISWPQCPRSMGIPSRKGQGAPMPSPRTRFVLVGTTNGPGFHPNPCLARQLRWVERHHVYAAAYAMTTYPTTRQVRTYGVRGPHPHAHLRGRLWNTGYAQARFNLATMRRVGLVSPVVWVDVEPYPVAPWSSSTARNAAVVDGAVRAYQRAGYRVGLYSTATLWREVVGGLRYRLPEWRTAGQRSRSAALRMCSTAPIQGGRAVIAQWWDARRDHDVLCPGTPGATGRYFHRF